MSRIDDLIDFLQDAASKDNAVYIPPDELMPLIADLKDYRRQFKRHEELLAKQRKALTRANRVFKQANHWPEYTYPDLSLLFDWLMDHCGKRQIVKLQFVIESSLELLTKIGDVPLLGKIQIDAYIITLLREKLNSVLSELNDQNLGFEFTIGQPCTYCINDGEEGEDEFGQYLEY